MGLGQRGSGYKGGRAQGEMDQGLAKVRGQWGGGGASEGPTGETQETCPQSWSTPTLRSLSSNQKVHLPSRAGPGPGLLDREQGAWAAAWFIMAGFSTRSNCLLLQCSYGLNCVCPLPPKDLKS